MTSVARHTAVQWLAVVALFALLCGAVVSETAREIGDPGNSDSIAFAAAARLVIDDPHHLYDARKQSAVEASLLHIPRSAGFIAPFNNLAAGAVLLSPLARLSLSEGSAAFALVSLVLFAASLLLMLRLLGRTVSRSMALLIAGGSVLCVPAIDAVIQLDSLLSVALLASALLAERRRFVVAGIVLAALVLKPQVVWLVVPALAAAGLWRYLGGFIIGAAAWLTASVVITGPGGLAGLVGLIAKAHISETSETADLPSLLAGIAGGATGYVLAGVLALVATALLWWKRDLLRGRPLATLAIGIPLSLLCAPHVSPEDLMLLTVTFAFLARSSAVVALLEALALSGAAVLQLAMPSNARHLFPLALALATATVWRALPEHEPADKRRRASVLSLPRRDREGFEHIAT